MSRIKVKKQEDTFKLILNRIPDLKIKRGLVKHLKQYKQEYPKSNFVENTVWHKLTLGQKEELLKIEQFRMNFSLQSRFIKLRFRERTFQEDELEREEEMLVEIRKYLSSLSQKFKSLGSYYLTKQLINNKKRGIYSEKLFREFLESPHHSILFVFKSNYQQKTRTKWKEEQVQNAPSISSQNSLVEEYLKNIFRKNENYNQYLPYFEKSYLEQIFYKQKLLKGGKVANIHKIFSESELKNLNELKMLDLKNNKQGFGLKEKVSLELKVKNIQRLSVRVFEINTENYLKQKMNKSYDQIEVSGLIPFEEYQYSYSQPPMIKHGETFEFQSITDKGRGVFIVDFVGDNLNSRAIIEKGFLTLLFDEFGGRSCVVLDEKLRVCKSKNLGLYVQNVFIKANPDTGVILVPWNIAEVNGQVLVVYDDFADLCLIQQKKPNIQLFTNVIFNSESFRAGNSVDLVLQNKLLWNSRPVDIEKLDKVEISIETVNDLGVKNNFPFKDAKLSGKEDLKLNFMFPSKVQSISVRMNAEFKAVEEPTKVSSVNWIYLSQVKSRSFEVYLRKDEAKNIVIEVLGLNGEPISNR